MDYDFARPLATTEQANQFLVRALGYKSCLQTGDLAVKVSKAETLLSKMSSEDSLRRSSYRHPSYSSDDSRVTLREKIVEGLVSSRRPPNDEDISFEHGGVMPSDGIGVVRERQAFILVGLPASGKSSIANRISDEYGAYIVDSDFAKRKFPEYKDEYGAALVHEESMLVTFGLNDPFFKDEPNVLGFCVSEGVNVVIPKIGARSGSIRSLRDMLISYGYDVHLTLVKVDRLCATKRAVSRFCDTSRYVPISLIFDGYSNDPILNYYYMLGDVEWASVGVVSTEGASPVFVSAVNDNPARLYEGG